MSRNYGIRVEPYRANRNGDARYFWRVILEDGRRVEGNAGSRQAAWDRARSVVMNGGK